MLRVLDSSGKGRISEVISALNWVRSNQKAYRIGATVLGIANFDLESSIAQEINTLIDSIIMNGTMVIIAAGNNGVSGQINQLALNRRAIVVGAMTDADEVSSFSSHGFVNDGDVRNPDLLAPGGSILVDKGLIISADSNQSPDFGGYTDQISNDLRSAHGTSLSAGIVGGIYNLLLEYLGGWHTWIENSADGAKLIKNYLLMTATELNQDREDDPRTLLDESSLSPQINRGNPDFHEGYGRINPLTVIEALSSVFPMNSTAEISLTSSSEDPLGLHSFGTTIILEQNKTYSFTLTDEALPFSNFDADIFLYNKTGDQFGNPVIISSSTSGDSTENFIFSHINSTDEFFLIVKAVSGEGTVELNVTEYIPQEMLYIANGTVNSRSSLRYNDTLDTFRFEVNYTQPENLPAGSVFLSLNTSQNLIPMFRLMSGDSNFSDGAIYYTDIQFQDAGLVDYFFIAQTGNFTARYPENGQLSFMINPIHHFVNHSYSSDFSQQDDYWDLDWFNTSFQIAQNTTASLPGCALN